MKRKHRQRWSVALSWALCFSLLVPALPDKARASADMIKDWAFSAFGDNTSPAKNPEPVITGAGVNLSAAGGKISSSTDGISFFYKELPATANFTLYATAEVIRFNGTSTISTPNQKSFGLMLRDQVGVNGDASGHIANYMAVGALDTTAMKGFFKQGTQTKLAAFNGVNAPAAGEQYELGLRKSGNTYVVSVNGESEIVTVDELFADTMYLGLYVARDAEVFFSNIRLAKDVRAPVQLQADTAAMKTVYSVGEALDLTGLRVKAVYEDGTEEMLPAGDYIVTGFDSSRAGTYMLALTFNGASTEIPVQITALTVTDLQIKYYPAKTEYYLGDVFDPAGLTVDAQYNTGIKRTLAAEEYTITVADTSLNGTLDSPGTKTVRITSKETPGISAAFDILVKNASITGLQLAQLPEKTQYFIGDAPDMDGLVVYASYSDGTKAY